MRKRDRRRPLSLALDTSALASRAAARPTRLSSCGVCPAWRHNARTEPGHKGRARPKPARPRGLPPTTSRIPTAVRCSSRSFHEWNAPYVAVDALGCDPLAPASLHRLVYTYNQRISFGYKRLHQQPQEHTTHFPTGPASAAEHAVVAMELLLLVYKPIARRAELTVLLPGARIAPARST